ncbi:MAG: hypothetical protein JW394_1001 [Nitrospira sp.]|nr:hypothetical protein [Nitrospira sp.]
MQAVYDEVLADIEQRIKDAAEFEGTEKEMGERGKKAARAKKAGIDWFKPGAASFSLEGDASAAKSEKGDANAKAPPPIPKDAYKVVMEYAVSAIQSGSAAESAFNAEVEMEFGPKIKPYLADIFKTATKMKSLMAVKTKEGKTVRKPKVKETTADIAARIGKERDADPEASLDPTDIVGMVRANVEAGAGGGVTGEGKAVLAEAIRMTTEQLQEEGIELTEDEVRDAFTQYGQKTKLKKDSLSVKMREIRRIGQLVSAVRDAVQGKKEAEAALAAGEKPTSLTKPQLTGLEREKATQAVRDMDKARIAAIKELQEAASALGIDIGGAGSMASTLAAAKTRMTNAIEDVEREIRTKQRIQRSKKGVNYDAEATELKAKLDARRKERDEIFGPSELTDEQRLAAALAAAIRNEKEWNSKLVMAQLGIFEPTASTYRPVTSPELEEIKARTAAAREAVADLKAADSATQEAAKEKQLEARIAELEKQLASGIIAAPEKQQTAETQRVTELTARRDELKKAITARRKANQPVPDAEQKKLEALESQLARLIENKPKAEKAATVDTAEQAFARQQLEAARAELAEKRKNQPFDPDAWLAKTEKAIATRTAKLEERLASGDILPPVKAERPTSPALEAARHKYDKLIGELNRQRFKLELANRSRAGKFFGSIAEILQTSRAIITGGELSAVLRQGGFSTLGHPILGMQSAGEMLKSFVSERKAHTTQDEVNHWLQGSPMRGKLDITQHSGIRKHHMEEAYMSRWINENIPAWLRKIPVLGFGIETGRRFIAASARAYSTYLNVLRMKVAKNLLKTLPLNPAKPTQAEIQQIADFVNASTGRGKMPKRWQGGAVALNTLFFAPKNFISRVQLLIGQPLWHGTMRTRLIVAKEYARFLIGAATILALAKLGQDDDDPPIETDLRSSDFLKVRFGNTRLDIFSGLIQPLVFAGRTGTLETKTIAGKVKSLHGEAVKYGGDDWSDVAFRFGRTKFAPAPSATFDLLSGRNVVGQPASATDIGANMIIPMTFRDIAHAMEEQGATKGTILSMLAILGMGVNTFSDRKQTPPTGMNADAVVLKSRHELPVPSLSQKSKRPVFQGF